MTVDASWLMSTMKKGPLNLGMNLATHFSPLATYCCQVYNEVRRYRKMAAVSRVNISGKGGRIIKMMS